MGSQLRRQRGPGSARRLSRGWTVACCALLLLIAPGAAQATTYNVTETNDENDPSGCTAGDCALREAILDANESSPQDDTINLPDGRYTLDEGTQGEDGGAQGDLDIGNSNGDQGALTILGGGARETIVDGNRIDRVLDVFGPEATELRDLTVARGSVDENVGGGIRQTGRQPLRVRPGPLGDDPTAAVLTLRRVTVRNNETEDAGDGGGISTGATLRIFDSTVSANNADGDGGGISISPQASLTMSNSTVSGNTANAGGGIHDFFGSNQVRSSTIASNEAGFRGGGIFVEGDTTRFKNTIVANNQAGDSEPNCFDQTGGVSLISQGNNLENTAECDFTAPSDQQNADARLGPLANNGGPTNTHALLSGSDAINRGDNSACPPRDQRGVVRPQGPRCDIGAFERAVAPPPPPPPPSSPCTISGTDANDIIRGTPGDDVICAKQGNDVVYGLGGNDRLIGDEGNDVLRGGEGDDRLEGRSGNDVMHGDAGDDVLRGGDGDDDLAGGDGDDSLHGGQGTDDLTGQRGRDSLDSRDGVGGNDVVNGGPDPDSCTTDEGDVTTACG